MIGPTIDIDRHRGKDAQKATELRRLTLEDIAEHATKFGPRQDELEERMLAEHSASWQEAADKARYLLLLFAGSLAGQAPRRQLLIARVMEDFSRLASGQADDDASK